MGFANFVLKTFSNSHYIYQLTSYYCKHTFIALLFGLSYVHIDPAFIILTTHNTLTTIWIRVLEDCRLHVSVGIFYSSEVPKCMLERNIYIVLVFKLNNLFILVMLSYRKGDFKFLKKCLRKSFPMCLFLSGYITRHNLSLSV